MKSESNLKRSKSMKIHWENNRDLMVASRTPASREVQSQKSKQHFLDHPEHRKAISDAQKSKWAKYKKAVNYCKQNNIDLGL